MRRILSSLPVRSFTKLVMYASRQAGRVASFARTRALFPNNPDLTMHWSVEVKYPENMTFGKNVVIGPGTTLGAVAPIHFGDDVHISKNVFVETGLGDIFTLPPYRSDETTAKPIRIGDGVWLGANALVLGGVSIGTNSVVAAGTVVRKNVPAESIVSSAKNSTQDLSGLQRRPSGIATSRA